MVVNPSPCKAIKFSISPLDIAVSLRYTLDTSYLALRCVDSRVAARNAHPREAFFIWFSPGIIPMFARIVKCLLKPSPAPRKGPSDRPAVPRRQIPGPCLAARLRPSPGLVRPIISELKQVISNRDKLRISHIDRLGNGYMAHA